MGEVTRVQVRHLGTVAYTEALAQMKGLQKQRIEDEIPDVMLILEPVSYTHLTLPTTPYV